MSDSHLASERAVARDARIQIVHVSLFDPLASFERHHGPILTIHPFVQFNLKVSLRHLLLTTKKLHAVRSLHAANFLVLEANEVSLPAYLSNVAFALLLFQLTGLFAKTVDRLLQKIEFLHNVTRGKRADARVLFVNDAILLDDVSLQTTDVLQRARLVLDGPRKAPAHLQNLLAELAFQLAEFELLAQ